MNGSGDTPSKESWMRRDTVVFVLVLLGVACHSLKAPALVVTIGFDEKKQETVTFGRSEKDVFASRSDEPGAAKLDASGLDEVIKALDALK